MIGFTKFFAPMLLGVFATTSSSALAQNQDTWRAATAASAAVAIYGLVKHDSKLVVIGVAGAIFSANKADRARHDRYDRRRYDDRDRDDNWRYRNDGRVVIREDRRRDRDERDRSDDHRGDWRNW